MRIYSQIGKLFLPGFMKTWLANNKVISPNVPCLSLFTVLFDYVVVFLVVLWLGICAEVAVDRISRIST